MFLPGVVLCLFCVFAFTNGLASPAWSLKEKGSRHEGHSGLRNAHIRVAIGPWSPYIVWKCPESASYTYNAKLGKGAVGDWGEECPNGGERTYSGIMWDLINFMAEKENFTVSYVESPDVCGMCFDRHNCSGMTGMVNRGEVDIAIMPFFPTLSRAIGVDFSAQMWRDHYTIALPLKKKDNMLLFLYSFSVEVWVAIFMVIPVVMLAMLLAEWFYSKSFACKTSVSFVLKTAFLDASCKIPEKNFSITLALIWMMAIFCLESGYAGNLKAILAKPLLEKTIANAEDLANQAKIPWVIDRLVDDFYNYGQSQPEGSSMRTLSDQAKYIFHGDQVFDITDSYGRCLTPETHADKYATICQGQGVRDLLARDFSATGKCNYYTSEDTFLDSPQLMLIQVGIAVCATAKTKLKILYKF